MPMGLGHPQLEIVHLLGKRSQHGHPLLGGNKLGAHLLMQPCLLAEAVLIFLQLMKEPRFPPAASDKGLKGDDGQNTKNT